MSAKFPIDKLRAIDERDPCLLNAPRVDVMLLVLLLLLESPEAVNVEEATDILSYEDNWKPIDATSV